jgi:magnesium-transporting ATPase (P-type)
MKKNRLTAVEPVHGARDSRINLRLLAASQKEVDTLLRQPEFSYAGCNAAVAALLRQKEPAKGGVLSRLRRTLRGAARAEDLVTVQREGEGKIAVPRGDVVYGDLVYLEAGECAPADLRLIHSEGLVVDQGAVSAQCPVREKTAERCAAAGAITDCRNLVFAGSRVLAGTALGLVLAVGEETFSARRGWIPAVRMQPDEAPVEAGA